jgi:hypothetical protein
MRRGTKPKEGFKLAERPGYNTGNLSAVGNTRNSKTVHNRPDEI